jgi:DNA-binding IclR family transcriptional regulator
MSLMVARTLSFLELFAAQKRPLSNADISRMLHLSASSCHDVLQVLEARGYLYKSAQRACWYPTPRLLEVAATIAANDPVMPGMLAQLRQLRDTLDESVLLTKVDGLQAIYLLVLESSHPLRYLGIVGDRVRSLHATSAGKALLAGLSDAALKRFLGSAALTPYTPLTIKSAAALRKDIAAGNERGWFLDAEESEPGLTTLSCRFDSSSETYIVTVAGPTLRLQPILSKACRLLTRLCRQLGRSSEGNQAGIRRASAPGFRAQSKACSSLARSRGFDK